MKKLGILLIVFFCLPSLGMADVYVKVGETNTKRGLSYTYAKLQKMKMKMFYKTSMKNYKPLYSIYSGPYRSPRTQKIALKNARIFFKGAKLVQLASPRSPLKKKLLKKTTATPTKISTKTTPYSVGIGLGYATAPSTHVIKSGSVSIVEPKNSGLNTLLYIGYDLNEDFYLSLNYMKMDAEDLVFDNFYATLNYKFATIGDFIPYFGVSMGASSLRWNTSPLEQANAEANNDSESLLYGTQLGLSYKGFNMYRPFVQYHCMFMQHATNLTQEVSNTSKLQHKTLHSILFGIGYSF